MVRTIVQLTEEQKAKLERLAGERGVSVSALVREAVDRLTEQPSLAEKWDRALAAIERADFRDIEGKTDIGRNHDKYLAEVLQDWQRKS